MGTKPAGPGICVTESTVDDRFGLFSSTDTQLPRKPITWLRPGLPGYSSIFDCRCSVGLVICLRSVAIARIRRRKRRFRLKCPIASAILEMASLCSRYHIREQAMGSGALVCPDAGGATGRLNAGCLGQPTSQSGTRIPLPQ